MRTGGHDSTTNEGDVRSRYDIDAEPVLLSGVRFDDYHKIERAIRSIEKAAYDRAAQDMLRHMRGFKAST